jgi:hypothetical protein
MLTLSLRYRVFARVLDSRVNGKAFQVKSLGFRIYSTRFTVCKLL